MEKRSDWIFCIVLIYGMVMFLTYNYEVAMIGAVVVAFIFLLFTSVKARRRHRKDG